MTKVLIFVSARYVVWAQVICLFLALPCSRADALSNDRSIQQFEHTAWGPKDGAPSVIRSLTQIHGWVSMAGNYIGREALINAFRHSGGLHIEVQITYHPRQLRLRVCDDGQGIDPAILEKQGRENHWGLTEMQERAQRIGAEVKLSSRRGEGTEVDLTVPVATAYRAWFWWKYFRRTESVSYLGPGEQDEDAAMTS